MNKNALITGGSRGIGRLIAIKFAQNLINPHIIYHKNTKMAYDTLTEIIKSYTHYIMRKLSDDIGLLWINGKDVDKFYVKNFKEEFTNNLLNILPNYEDFQKELDKNFFTQIKLSQKMNNFSPLILSAIQNLSTGCINLMQELISFNCCIFKGDIVDEGFVNNSVDKIISSVGKIDFLVSNAGVDYYSQVQDICESDIKDVINTNLIGTINIVKACSPHMIREKFGKIITISSMHGIYGSSCESVYSATKGGIISFTKSIAKELGPSNINCNVICPGVCMTDMMHDFSDDDIRALKEQSSLKKVSYPEDIAETVYFLVSEGGSIYNGKIFSPDCGFMGDEI